MADTQSGACLFILSLYNVPFKRSYSITTNGACTLYKASIGHILDVEEVRIKK